MQTTLDLIPRYSLPLVAVMLAAIVVSFLVVRLATGPAVSLARRGGLLATRAALILLLVALLANPVRVEEEAGEIEPADVFFVLDASESMALDDGGSTRWQQAVDWIAQSAREAGDSAQANVSLFRFGRRLQAIAGPQALGLSKHDLEAADHEQVSLSAHLADDPASDKTSIDRAVPDEPDTQMLVALRQLTSRFGRRPPAAVVVFSDGRARDAQTASEVAGHFARLGVPIHVVPLGDSAKGGDVSVVSLIAPATIRKHSQVNVHAFVRSYGYDGQRAEVDLLSVAPGSNTFKKLDAAPLTLTDGFQSVNLSFQSDETTRTLRAHIQPRPDEIATDNNQFDTDVRVDRTKIRVLYVEGSPMRLTTVQQAGRLVVRGPHSNLQEALEEDPDVECTVLSVSGSMLSVVAGQVNAFPRTPAELSAYDAIVLSSVPSSAFTDEQLGWIDEWVGRRGAGLCMVGGQYSFGGGDWDRSPLSKILPVQGDESGGGAELDSSRSVAVHPDISEPLHPIFRLLEDRSRNRELLTTFPAFRGAHASLAPRPNVATVLAAGVQGERVAGGGLLGGSVFRRMLIGGAPDDQSQSQGTFPAITAGRYARGRTLAVAMPITGPPAEEFLNWGVRGNQYYARFWRNAIYWLTENSFVGRRRLAAAADKRFYEPGEGVTLTAVAYDEAANHTSSYRLVAMIEPQSLDIDSDYAPVRWPSGMERTSGEEGALVAWGEEFEIPVRESPDGQKQYAIDLTLADAQTIGQSSGGMRLELTAYEDYTQVDSTSLPLQVLYDPFEQQNPFPNHELLQSLAKESGGTVLATPLELANVLKTAPVTMGAPEVRQTPVWSNWWLLVSLMGVLTVEWCWRRRIGLA